MKKYSFFLCVTILYCNIPLSAQMDGTLDPTYNSGVVTTSIGTGNAMSTGLAIQADGRILLTGNASNGIDNDFGIIRYKEDGTLDTDFNTTGKVQIDFNAVDDFPEGVAIRPTDGKIIVAGYTFNGSGFDFAVAQYLPDGTPDPMFGNNGRVITPLGTTAFCKALVVQNDGKIVTAGYSSQGNNVLTIIRYLDDGSPDNSFDGDGIVMTPVGFSSATATSLLIQPDDKILVAGQAFNEATLRWEAALVRYHPNGSLDESFNESGVVTTAIENKDVMINAIARDTDGKILSGGYLGTTPSNNNFTLIRYLPDGRLDSMFGTNGVLVVPFSNQNNQLNALLIQPDHKIIAGGTATINGKDHFALARYDVNGVPDPAFGINGKVSTAIGNFAGIQGLAFDRQGRIVASGASFNGTSFQFTSARYLNDLETRTLHLSPMAKQLSVIPNPITSSFILNFTTDKVENLTIQLLDMQGRILTTYLAGVQTDYGDHAFAFELPQQLAAGNYFIRIVSPTGTASIRLSH